MYEPRHRPPIPRPLFLRRLALHGGAAAGLVLLSLAVGMAGYMACEHLSPLDAFVNAAMLLSGMGPLHAPGTPSGKLFAGLYALYSGFVVLIAAGIASAPVVHRLLHTFHWQEDEGGAGGTARGGTARADTASGGRKRGRA